MLDFTGNYSYVRSENFEEYLTKIGIPAAAMQAALSSSPTITVVQNGVDCEIEVKSPPMNHHVQFKIDEEFDDSFPDGDIFKSTARMVGNAMVITSKGTKRGDLERTYTLDGDEMVTHMRNLTHDVEAKRFFKKTG